MNVIEKSKRLEECADWHDHYAFQCKMASKPENGELHEQWADDIRSIIIPEPLNETENIHSKDIEG